MITITTITVIAALLTKSYGLHNDETPLRGYHCKSDAQHPCDLCPEGFYCIDKSTLKKCGSVDVYCPKGSVRPTPVSEGYFTTDVEGREDQRVNQSICETGHYCSGGKISVCPKGHYCNSTGMTEPFVCGNPNVYCPEGSVEPKLVTRGFYSIGGGSNTTRQDQTIAPKGYYAKEGLLFECPGGHYGNSSGLFHDDCSGICNAGWYCPPASISPRQKACGSENYFCPEGSSFPQPVREGYYTTVFNEEPCRPGKFRVPLPEEVVGLSSVKTSLKKDSCILCPQGMHKPISGDSYSLCMDCGPKAFTKDGISCECFQSATEKKMSTQLFYDWTSGSCFDITDEEMEKYFPDDFHEPGGQFSKSVEMKCEAGHYCQNGVRHKCPSGLYGHEEMMVNAACSGPCGEGYYCPPASISPNQNACGNVDVFCPMKSSSPTYVSKGYYSNEDDPIDKKTSQHLCPPGYYCPGDGMRYQCPSGRYGSSSGLSNEACDGECQQGFFCEPGSTSPRQSPCGNATVYCPKASSVPSRVDRGYYSASESYAITAFAGPNATHDMQRECEIGYWCRDGIKYYCPIGTFGELSRSTDVDECKPCEPGFYCRSQPAPPTTKDTQVECGDASKYCPLGSAEPRDVDLGYYTINRFGTEEGFETQRTSQVMCPRGYFCKDGLRFKCAEGKYGETSGLYNENCSGFCPRGFFCPENTVHPMPCSPGSFASGGAKECTSCEVPLTVPIEIKNSMCRNDRSCCFEYQLS